MKYIRFVVLLCVFQQMAFAENKLTLFITKSPSGIDWSTPRSLSISTLINTVQSYLGRYRHSLGHVSMRVKCDDLSIDQYAGMSRKDFSESRDLVLFGGAGLGSLLHNFQGRMEDREDIVGDVQHNAETGDVVLLSFLINENACKRVDEFLTYYRQNEFWRNYGLPNRPLKGQGSGCSAFGMGILEIAGVDYSTLDRFWSDHVFVPNGLIGPHNNEIYQKGEDERKKVDTTRSKVSFWKLATGDYKWGEERESVVIKYYSPDKMYKWARAITDGVAPYPQGFVKMNKFENTYEIILDKTGPDITTPIELPKHDTKNI